MSKVLAVADSKLILMLCLAKLRRDVQRLCDGTVRQICCVLINKDILDIPLTKLIVIIVHQICESMVGYEYHVEVVQH